MKKVQVNSGPEGIPALLRLQARFAQHPLSERAGTHGCRRAWSWDFSKSESPSWLGILENGKLL